jgi:hypothetical protein
MNGFHRMKWRCYAVFHYPKMLQKYHGVVECTADICYNDVGVKALSSVGVQRYTPHHQRRPVFFVGGRT